MLEAIKNFLWADKVVFVLALDREQVLRALIEERQRHTGDTDLSRAVVNAAHYLEKFFLYSFELEDPAAQFQRGVVVAQRKALWQDFKRSMPRSWLPNRIQPFYELTAPNLRRIKRVLRWAYFEAPLARRKGDLTRRCAEFVFRENCPLLWASSFVDEPQAVRAQLYLRIESALNMLMEFNGDTASVTNDRTLRDATLAVLRKGDAEAAIGPLDADQEDEDAIREVFAPAALLAETAPGEHLAWLLERGDDEQLRRIYNLACPLAA